MSHASQRPHRCDICAADMCNGNGDGQHNEQQIGDAWSSTYGNTFGNGSASNMTSISDTIFGFGKRSIATQSSEDLIYPTSPPPPYHNHVQHDKFESIDNTDQVEDDDLTDVDEATYDEEQVNGAEQTTDEEDNHAAQTYQTDCDNQHEQLDYFQQSQFQTEQLTNIDHDVDHEIQNGEETEDVEVQQQQQIFHYYNREVDGVDDDDDDDDDDDCAIKNDGTSNLIMNNEQQEQTYSGQQQEEYTVTENGNEILSDIELFEENVGETNEYENVPVENNHVEHQQLDDDGITNQTKSTDIYDFNSDDDGPTMTNQPMAQIANGCIIQQQQQQQTTSNSLTTQPTHTIQLQSYIHPHQSHIAHHPQQQIATHPHHQPPVPHQNNRNHHPQAFQLPPHMTTGNHPQFITINPSHGSTPFATTTHTAGSGNFQLDTFAANGQTIRLVSISTAFNSQQQGAQQLPHQHQTTTNVTPHLHPLQTQHQQQQQQQQLQLSELSTNQTPNPTKKRSSKKAKQADNVLVQPQVSANTIPNSSTDQANLSSDNLNNTIGLPIIPFVPTKGKGKGNRKPRINFISVIDGITVGADGVRRKFHCSHCGNAISQYGHPFGLIIQMSFLMGSQLTKENQSIQSRTGRKTLQNCEKAGSNSKQQLQSSSIVIVNAAPSSANIVNSYKNFISQLYRPLIPIGQTQINPQYPHLLPQPIIDFGLKVEQELRTHAEVVQFEQFKIESKIREIDQQLISSAVTIGSERQRRYNKAVDNFGKFDEIDNLIQRVESDIENILTLFIQLNESLPESLGLEPFALKV
ncbi:hypothetical protein BLOT_010616 [Blomia tropicalis]|nr:hypothetical protein BLOT_010616 [Blomia tropicalis]